MHQDAINFSITDHKPFNPIPMNGGSGWFEIRLFYVRISPCVTNTVPGHLTLRNLRREIGVSLEINGIRVPSGNTALVTLRRDRVARSSSEVVYVSTDNVRVSGAVEFEVIDDREMVLCGSLERIEPIWSNGNCNQNAGGLNSKGWSMDFYARNLMKFGNSSASVEVYIAGCCSSVPVILTKTIQVGSRRRCGVLDAIPEDEEVGKEPLRENVVVRHRKSTHPGEEGYEYESEAKLRPSYYSEEMYYDEDGQLTWFNAGVRVGVGIGLGMCLGIGIGVGFLMRSYQATTRNFRRRFF